MKAVPIGTACAVALAACGSTQHGQVVKVTALPWPEGPGPVVAAERPQLGVYVPLHEIAHDLPSSFPANPRQRCSYGAEVEITFRSGRVLTYGPCRRPAAIERLRLALIDASRHPHVTAHYVTTPGTVALLAEGAGASGGAAVPHPSLTLSRSSGSAGTRVFIVGRGCIKPVGQPDVLAWHDHYYWRHDIEKRPPLGVWRAIPLVRTSMTTVRSIFVVRRTEHLGRGLLDLMCRTGGNAIATFVVTR